tara:strand:+ start:327 stop:515 length:189 start_codon:yes stop_codon:yes gene_type:complete
MKILLTGIDGYCEWPLALSISKKYKKSKIISVDNLSRRRWVNQSMSNSAIGLIYALKKISYF